MIDSIVVIGAGPAGIYFAKKMLNLDYKVQMFDLIVEQVPNETSPTIDSFIDGHHHPLSSGRIGGATSFGWSGGLGRFSRSELELGSWTLDGGEIFSFYQRVEEQLFGNSFEEFLLKINESESKTFKDGIERVIYQYIDCEIFLKTFEELKSHQNFQFYQGHYLADINQVADKTWVLKFLDTRSKFLEISSEQVVLAAGGIGNAQILLNSTSALFDDFNFQLREHPAGIIAHSKSRSISLLIDSFDQKIKALRLARSVRAPTAAYAVCLNPKNASFVQFEIRRQRKVQSKFTPRCTLIRRVFFLFLGILNACIDLVFGGQYDLFCQFSDLNELTRNTLKSENVTSYKGLPAISFKYSFSENLPEHARQTVTLVNEQLNNLGQASARFKLVDWLSRDKEFWEFGIGAHPSATITMSSAGSKPGVPQKSVLNPATGLFILGSAAFPIEGSGNPTLTILAQVESIVDHIKKRNEN